MWAVATGVIAGRVGPDGKLLADRRVEEEPIRHGTTISASYDDRLVQFMGLFKEEISRPVRHDDQPVPPPPHPQMHSSAEEEGRAHVEDDNGGEKSEDVLEAH